MSIYETIEKVASSKPDHAFLQTRETELSYGEAISEAETLAARIRAEGPTDRPCLIQAASVTASLAVLACLRIGKPFIVVNPSSPVDRVAYYQQDSGANVLVRDIPPRERAEIGSTVQIEVIGLFGRRGPWHTTVAAETVACLIYTSGSTGQPKAVVCTDAAMDFVADAIGTVLEYGDDDVVLTALPLFFDFGLYQVLLAGAAGSTVYFASGLESGLGLSEALQRTRATILPMVPPAAEKLANLAGRGLQRHHVRMLTTTGAALDAGTRLALREAWGQEIDLRVMYGLTECKRVAIMPAHESFVLTGASGLPLPGTRVTIRPHGEDAELDAGEVGEICVEGPHLMAGYHNQPELTASRYRRSAGSTVLRTGDSGYLDPAGYLFCLGRDDAQFKVKGYRVSSAEVVAAAKTIDGVVSAAVVPPSEERAFALFFEGPATEDLVAEGLRRQLEPFAVPTLVTHLDQLPVNANGKTDMKQLEKEMTS